MTQKSRELSCTNQKISLVLWWKQFKEKQGWKKFATEKIKGIFGVPLQISLRYANVAISFIDNNGNSVIYGYIPIVVAKCGAFLKENGKDVQGIFRLNGSTKRCKELQTIFDSPPKYGRNLKWDSYTVHDAANILRRYLNYLPEPIIPHKFYEAFRKPLRNEFYDKEKSLLIYKKLIMSLPSINRQLLLYILDLLAVFASKSDENLMTISNLSSIFQPGILSHPEHDMSPKDYTLSQKVLIFLIGYQDYFLMDTIGIDPNLLMTPPHCENTDSYDTSSSIDSIKFSSKKEPKVLKKTHYINLKFRNSFKNKHSRSMDFNLRNSFRFLLRSNTLPSKSYREIDPCTSQNLITKKSNISKNISRSPLRRLSTEENKTFHDKLKKINRSSTKTSAEDMYIYSTPKTSKSTKSIIYTFPLSLIDVIRLSKKAQKKSLHKALSVNLSTSSLKTSGACSNASPLRSEPHLSFSSRSTQSVRFSRANSIPSSITSNDRLSRDGSIFVRQMLEKGFV